MERNKRLQKGSMQCYYPIIQLTIIWWRLLCVRSCANNSLNPNVLLCSSQMSWSACDRIGVDLAVNCSVKSVVSESWGKMSFIFHHRTVTWIWMVNHTHSTGWTSNENPPIWISKARNSVPIFIWLENNASVSSTPGLYSGKCKAPSSLVSSGWSFTPTGALTIMCGKSRNSTDHRFGHLRRKKSRPRMKEGRIAALIAWF